MAIRAAIFDLDGTLLDSTGIWRQIDEIFLGRRGFDVPADYFEAVSSMNLQQGAEYTKAALCFCDRHREHTLEIIILRNKKKQII